MDPIFAPIFLKGFINAEDVKTITKCGRDEAYEFIKMVRKKVGAKYDDLKVYGKHTIEISDFVKFRYGEAL